jgi:hypothetical protein
MRRTAARLSHGGNRKGSTGGEFAVGDVYSRMVCVCIELQHGRRDDLGLKV